MLNKIREIASGKKNRYKDSGYNLDLTYITPRIIAMSFPASGVESVYRNKISDVTELLTERHGEEYMVFNLSGRKYDYKRFKNKVVEFPWEDHHSPPISVLFEVCEEIDSYLKSSANSVIVVHCLAGKGRTGTVICCYLLYCGRFHNYKEALAYYGKKRFSNDSGVTQPSQIRYVSYFHQLFMNHRKTPVVMILKSITINGVPNFNSEMGIKPIIEVIDVKKMEKIYSEKKLEDIPNFIKIDDQPETLTIELRTKVIVKGDVLVRIKSKGRIKDHFVTRFAFNTAFIPDTNTLSFPLPELDPDSTIKDKRFPCSFSISANFESMCECTNQIPFEKKCLNCLSNLQSEIKDWESIYRIMHNFKPRANIDSSFVLFGDPDLDDVEEVLKLVKSLKILTLEDMSDNIIVNEIVFPACEHSNIEILEEKIQEYRKSLQEFELVNDVKDIEEEKKESSL